MRKYEVPEVEIVELEDEVMSGENILTTITGIEDTEIP